MVPIYSWSPTLWDYWIASAQIGTLPSSDGSITWKVCPFGTIWICLKLPSPLLLSFLSFPSSPRATGSVGAPSPPPDFLGWLVNPPHGCFEFFLKICIRDSFGDKGEMWGWFVAFSHGVSCRPCKKATNHPQIAPLSPKTSLMELVPVSPLLYNSPSAMPGKGALLCWRIHSPSKSAMIVEDSLFIWFTAMSKLYVCVGSRDTYEFVGMWFQWQNAIFYCNAF